MTRRPPSSPLFPYTTLFRSQERFGERYLPFQDPDGLWINLIETKNPDKRTGWETREIHAGVALMGFHTVTRSEEHTSELQSRENLVCRLLLEKKKINLRIAS